MEENPDQEFGQEIRDYAQIEPELQEWVDREHEKQKAMVTKMKDEFIESEEFEKRGYDKETLNEVFEEIIAQDELSDEGAANKFFEEMWNKLEMKVNPNRP